MINDHDQQINDIIGAVENVKFRDVLLENNSHLLKKIGIFVLLLGKLEYRIKTVLYFAVNSPPPDIWSTMTLGGAIKKLENRLPEIRETYIRNPRDYRHKVFLQEGNIQLFISQCDKLNKLRNDLIHNFISPQRSGLENNQLILDQVEKVILGADDWDAYCRERQHQEILLSKKLSDNPDQLHLRTYEGDIRNDLPLGALIEICGIFYQILRCQSTEEDEG